MPAELSKSLLNRIMQRLKERGDTFFPGLTTNDLLDLVEEQSRLENPAKALYYLRRHIDFLDECGYLRSGGSLGADGLIGIGLTAMGQMFVQPELAEFGHPLLPEVVKSLEDNLQVLTYPQEEKDSLIFKLREALAKQAPDLVARAIAELGWRIMMGHP